jgi:hypothetical protein
VIRRRDGAEAADPADVPDIGQDHSGADPDKTTVLEVSPGRYGSTVHPVAASGAPAKAGLPALLRSVRWGPVFATAAVIFVISFGALLMYETIIHKSVSDAVKGQTGHGNSLIEVVTHESPSPQSTPTDAPSPTVAPSESTVPSVEPTPSVAPTSDPQSSQQPGPEASVPGGGATTAPGEVPASPAGRVIESPPPPTAQP